MASKAELDAAFEAVHQALVEDINARGGFARGALIGHLESAEGRQMTLDAITKGLAAAERVRANVKT